MMKLGEAGKQALYETGKLFGQELVQQHVQSMQALDQLSVEEK